MSTSHRTPKDSSATVSKINCYGAIIFVLGCTVLIVNAVLTLFALAKPDFQPPKQYVYAQGALSLLSSTLFVTGGGFGIVYCVKAKREEETLEGLEPTSPVDLSTVDVEKAMNDSRRNSATSDYLNGFAVFDEKQNHQNAPGSNETTGQTRLQRLWFSSNEVWKHYTSEIGMWTTIIFLCSSIIFLGAAIAAMVSIVQFNGIVRCIRYPQLVGSIGFVVASIMIMIQAYKQAHEERPGKWWQLPWHHRRWYVGLGNLAGSAGFTICSIAGLIIGAEWSKDQFGISFIWGSWFFLFASALQWQRSRSKSGIGKAHEAGH